MTIGEKIFKLRTRLGLSQEELADKLNVSRQSISKWELNESTPQPAKLVSLCDLFEINADTLLREDNKIFIDAKNEPSTKVQNKYFGTDGFRGEANVTLTSEHAYKVGRFIGWYFSKRKGPNEPARIIVGKDTRLSSYMLEYSLIAGMVASGAEAYMLHVTTTPSVSYITRMDEFDCGVMITASHNPYYDNGIKIINKIGEKLDDNTAHLIELYIDGKLDELGISENDIPYAKRNKIGKIVDYTAGRNRYIGYLISLASNSYKRLQIGIDTANGASWSIAKAVFEALGAQLHVTGGEPNGTNINSGVGSTHIENLVKLVKEHHLDVGFAFDGDADRCIAVDENGNIVDGDKILYLLARRLKSKDALDNNTVVTTVMSNTGLYQALDKQNISYEKTSVGDRFVYECMQDNHYNLGGEQSGHIIIKKYATTGDGILTAIMIAEEICDQKTSLSKLTQDVKLFPQLTKNVPVLSKDAVMNDDDIKMLINNISNEIGNNGRILLRKSGTEPVIRIMAECQNTELCNIYIDSVYNMMKNKGYTDEKN